MSHHLSLHADAASSREKLERWSKCTIVPRRVAALWMPLAPELLVAVGLAALALGCSDDGEADAEAARPALARLETPSDTFPQALIEGVLELRGGCVVIVTDDGPVLTLWPHEAVLVGGADVAVVIGDDRLPVDGVARTYGGGFMRENGAGQALEPPLDTCAHQLAADDLWLVSGLAD